jgi:hypothetical protein
MKNAAQQTRREFCFQVCQAASLAVLGGALSTLLESCSKNPMDSGGGNNIAKIQASVAGGAMTLTIDASSPLAAVGSAALVQASNNSPTTSWSLRCERS